MEHVSSKNVRLEYDNDVYNHEKIKSEFINELISNNIIPPNSTKINKDEHIISSSERSNETTTTTTFETIRNEIIKNYVIEPDFNSKKENKIPWNNLSLKTNKKIDYNQESESVRISSEFTTFYMDKVNSLKAGFMFCYIFGGLIMAFAIFFYLMAGDPDTTALIIPGAGSFLIILGLLLHLKYKGKNYQQKKAEPLRNALSEMATTFYDVVKNSEMLDRTYFHKDLVPVTKKTEEDFSIPLSNFNKKEFVQNMVFKLSNKAFIDGSLLGWSFKYK